MKLNPDCVRDILIACEENCTINNELEFMLDSPFVIDGRSYEPEETHYHLNQCELNGFFTEGRLIGWGSIYLVKDLTPKAHEFLANIRDDNNWGKTKELAKNAGVASLSALWDIAIKVAAAVIAAQFKG